MTKIYTIIEDGIRIGFFISETERDKAFEDFIIKSKRYAIKNMEIN